MNNIIVVDIIVSNLSIKAARPKHQTTLPMPTHEAEKFLFFNTVDLKRLNDREYGSLKGKALEKAKRLVNNKGGINMSGEYGSMETSDEDFIPF
jgi:hypothetical protein